MPLINSGIRLLKITGIIILSVAILSVPVINYTIPWLIRNKLSKSNNDHQNIQIGNISFNILRGEFGFKEVNIQISNSDKSTSIKISDLSLYRFSLSDLIRNKIINCGHLYASGILVEFKVPGNKNENISKIRKEDLPALNIGKITIKNLTVTKETGDSSIKDISIFNSEITMNGLIAKSNSSDLWWKETTWDDFKIIIPKVVVHTADELYTGTIHQIVYLSKEKLIVLDSLSLEPNLDVKSFFKKIKKETDRFDIKTGKVICHYDSLSDNEGLMSLIISSMSISDGRVFVYRDKNYYRPLTIKPTVQQLINKVDFPLEIKKLYVLKGNVQYDELGRGDAGPSALRISKGDVRIENINNRDSTGHLLILARSLLFEEGLVNVALDFPLNSNSFISTGIIKSMHFKKINNLLEENVHLKLKGNIDALQWEFTGGEEESWGNMQFTYSNLNVKFQDKDTKKTHGVDEIVKSFFANLILRKNNDPGNEELSSVPLSYKRDKTRFVFNYIAKTLLSGIKTTLGINTGNKTKTKPHDKGK